MEDLYTIELPDGTTITIDENGEIVESDTNNSSENNASHEEGNDDKIASANNGESPTDEHDGGNNTNDQSANHSSSENANVEQNNSNHESNNENGNSNSSETETNESPAKPTVASIKEKYEPSFQALESQANGKLNALVGRAKGEYDAKRANGEKIDVGYFYNKYYGAANALEAQTDAVFQGVLHTVEKDLAANGFDASYAENFAAEYEASKKARKDSLLSKALGK